MCTIYTGLQFNHLLFLLVLICVESAMLILFGSPMMATGWKINMTEKYFTHTFLTFCPWSDGIGWGKQRYPACWIASNPTPFPPSPHQLPAPPALYLNNFKQSGAAMNMFMPSLLQPGGCDVRPGSPREASSSIITALGSESLCLHQLSTQSGLWPTSTERSEWKWTRRWSDSVVESKCVCEREWLCVCVGGAGTEAYKVSRQWGSTFELSMVSLLLSFLSVTVLKCL